MRLLNIGLAIMTRSMSFCTHLQGKTNFGKTSLYKSSTAIFQKYLISSIDITLHNKKLN